MGNRIVILANVVSAFVFAIYFVMAMVVLKLPPGIFPYAVSIVGAAAMCGVAIRAVSEADRGSVMIGNLLTAVNIVVSIGIFAVIVAQLNGHDSVIGRILNYVPFPR